MNKKIVTIYTTNGDMNLQMYDEQVVELARLLQTEEEPVPFYTQTEQHYAVGMLIQGRVFTNYPRVIMIIDKEKSE